MVFLNVSEEHLTCGLLIRLTQRLGFLAVSEEFRSASWLPRLRRPRRSCELRSCSAMQQLAQTRRNYFYFRSVTPTWEIWIRNSKQKMCDSERWLILLSGDLLNIPEVTPKENLEWSLFPKRETVPAMLQTPRKLLQSLRVTDGNDRQEHFLSLLSQGSTTRPLQIFGMTMWSGFTKQK